MYIEHPHYFDMYFVVSRENVHFFLDFASLIVLYLFFWFCRSLISYKSSAISTNILEASYLIAGVGAEGRAQDCGWRRRSCYPRSLSLLILVLKIFDHFRQFWVKILKSLFSKVKSAAICQSFDFLVFFLVKWQCLCKILIEKFQNSTKKSRLPIPLYKLEWNLKKILTFPLNF